MTIPASFRTSFIAVTLLPLLLLIVAGWGLRVVQIEERDPIIADERTWLLTGTSLIQSSTPTAWTIFEPAYRNWPVKQVFDGIDQQVITPYLDHPPLFSLMIGIWAYATHNSVSDSLDWFTIRLPMVVLSIATIALTFFVSRSVFGVSVAWWTTLAYTFFPSHIISSPFVTPEHAIAFLLVAALGSYWWILHPTPATKRYRRVLLGILFVSCAAAPLMKLSGVLVPFSIVLLGVLERRWRLAALAGGGAATAGVLLTAYHGYYGIELWQRVLWVHHHRPQSVIHFWTWFTKLDIGHMYLPDPTTIAGLIGALLVAAGAYGKRASRYYLLAPLIVIAWLFTHVAPTEAYGWYKFSGYPLVALGIGWLWAELWAGKLFPIVLLGPLAALMLEHSLLVPETQTLKKVAALFLAVFVLSFVTKSTLRNIPLHRIATVVLAVIVVISETIWVLAL